MLRKYHTSTAMSPLAIALFANSTVTGKKINALLSMGSPIWSAIGKNCTGIITLVWYDSFAFQHSADYVVDSLAYLDCQTLMQKLKVEFTHDSSH